MRSGAYFFIRALRPWLLGATLTSTALHLVTTTLGGQTSSILMSVSTPSFKRILGMGGGASRPSGGALDQALMSFGEAWWALALACLALGLLAEYLRPDPVGLLARRRAGRGDAEAKESEAA